MNLDLDELLANMPKNAYFPQTIEMDSAQLAAFLQELAAGR